MFAFYPACTLNDAFAKQQKASGPVIRRQRRKSLKPAACGPLAGRRAAFHRQFFVRFAGLGLGFLGTLALALRAMGNIFLAGAKNVIAVFFLYFFLAFKNKIAFATDKAGHIRVLYRMYIHCCSEQKYIIGTLPPNMFLFSLIFFGSGRKLPGFVGGCCSFLYITVRAARSCLGKQLLS